MVKKNEVEEVKDRRAFEMNGVKYAVRRPNFDEIIKANEERAKSFNSSLQRGDLLRDQLDNELRKRKLWNDDREIRYQQLRNVVIEGDYSLSKGGIGLSEAKDIAFSMAEARAEMVDLLSTRTDLDSNTCEGKADTVRFNWLFSSCLVYDESDEPYFEDGIVDYIKNQDSDVSLKGATEFYYLLSNADDPDAGSVEDVFLRDYGFTNTKGQLIDKDGRLIDNEGRHLDEKGNFIKWKPDGTFGLVDSAGRPVSKKGNFTSEFSPFLDDDGEPVAVAKDKEPPKATKKKRKPKKAQEAIKAEEPKPEKNEPDQEAEASEEVAETLESD
tara:strand:+ start:224 stop:1204 length:981 start_codon:yes stop_codon:yes gene_type:complete